MALITKEEVEALHAELGFMDSANIRCVIITVLQKVAAEKLMTELELSRVYEAAATRQASLQDWRFSDKHGAMMLQTPELWELLKQKDAAMEAIERFGETMMNPPKAEEL